MTDMSHQGFETEEGAPSTASSAVMSAIDLVSAYVSNNPIERAHLVPLLDDVTTFIEKRLGGSTAARPSTPAGAAAVAEHVEAEEPAQTVRGRSKAAAPQPQKRAKTVDKDGYLRYEDLPPKPDQPAVPIKDSHPESGEYVICLEDGAKLKVLKRHLRTKYKMSPEDYRRRWNLPADYPMTAKSYSEARSSLAKGMGFGKRDRSEAQAA